MANTWIITCLLQNLEYRVDLHTRKCNVTQPKEPFRPIGVPPGATYLFEGVIGAAGMPGQAVTVATFGAQFEGNDFEVTVTYPDCFPVNHAFKGKDGHESDTM
ncbi:mammalian ependymin-related protein 1 [Plakobranchus ocellatus]|uniref:Mammalian ependymin-related protein 1 n=1 Tax=Plakobranchus ocellatus TaxID=259542 RepID=A0AAV4AA64_9GAST|nr:mammalian ependymin-related protein 1 [Plakobranchus ocellatus]